MNIPHDIYESNKEIVILIPLGGVSQDSITIQIVEYTLLLEGERHKPTIRPDLQAKQEKCYRGSISLKIQLPPHVYFDKIHSVLNKENILTIVVPKNIVPERIPITIEKE